MTTHPVLLDGGSLTLEALESIARHRAPVDIHPTARERMARSRAFVESVASSGKPTYGVNTGFGALAEVPIPPHDLLKLQRNLIVSHAVGVGEPLPFPVGRAMMVLRANVLCTGRAGVRPVVADALIKLLNTGAAPCVPAKGSVGASGDLAPLAHLALMLMGEGDAFVDEGPSGVVRVTAAEALARAGLSPLVFQAKEGLALVNGTQAMGAVGSLALLEAERLCELADVAGACTVEAQMGSHRPFEARIHTARPHPGQIQSAAHIRSLLEGSEIAPSHAHCAKVQDAYSLRCMPQVHGATRDALAYVRRTLEIEVNSATDNPLVFEEQGDLVSGGNFHGQPLALALDMLAIAVAELANISERRMEQLLNPTLSGLPPFLASHSGLNSGFMICQVTAGALVNENKVLCHPASVDSIPSSANREDHVSMGMTSANKATQVVENVRRVLGIELMIAAQALDARRPLKAGAGVERVYAAIRKRIPHLEEDRVLMKDLAVIDDLVRSGTILAAAHARA
ncbi:MAG: histidine ammonia-lyase [Myxococcota bacterium]